MGRIGGGKSDLQKPGLIAGRQVNVIGPQHHEGDDIPVGDRRNLTWAIVAAHSQYKFARSRHHIFRLLIAGIRAGVNITAKGIDFSARSSFV